MPRVAIMGFVGCGNLGDEAILAGNLRGLSQIGINDPLVFSWQPDLTKAQHAVDTAPVLPGRQGLLDFKRRLGKGDLLLLGGGSLLQDGQRRIVPFWLARAIVAKLAGAKVVFHAQGVGPLRTAVGRFLVRATMPVIADLVTLRDRASFALVPSLCRPELVADPALLLSVTTADREDDLIIVALRELAHLSEMEPKLQSSLKTLAAGSRARLLFVPMQHPDDVDVSRRFAVACGGELIDQPLSLSELTELLGRAQLVIAMRLHAAILSANNLTPVVGLAYDPKVSAFFQEIGMPEAVTPWDENFDAATFTATAERAFNERVGYHRRLQTVMPELRQRAQTAITRAVELWSGKALRALRERE